MSKYIEIRPALTSEEWAKREYYGWTPDGKWWRSIEPDHDCKNGLVIGAEHAPGFFDGDALPALMALANDALPSDDPRKITHETSRALDALIDIANDHEASGEGWRSDELLMSIDAARRLRDAIAALLPPE